MVSPATGARDRKQSGERLGPPDTSSMPRPSPTARVGRWGTEEQLGNLSACHAMREPKPQLGERDSALTCSGHDQAAARVQEGEESLWQQPHGACPEAESVLGRSTGSPAVSSAIKPSHPRQAPGSKAQKVPARLQVQAEAFPGPSANVTLLRVACQSAPGQKQVGFPAPLVTSETGEVWAEMPGSPGCTEGTLGLMADSLAVGVDFPCPSLRGHRQCGCPAASEISQQGKLHGAQPQEDRGGAGAFFRKRQQVEKEGCLPLSRRDDYHQV